MLAHSIQPAEHRRESSCIEFESQRNHRHKIRKPSAFNQSRRNKWPRLGSLHEFCFEHGENRVQISLTDLQQTSRRFIVALRPMPERTIHYDRVEAMIGQAL